MDDTKQVSSLSLLNLPKEKAPLPDLARGFFFFFAAD
jgi:hypothetical protein